MNELELLPNGSQDDVREHKSLNSSNDLDCGGTQCDLEKDEEEASGDCKRVSIDGSPTNKNNVERINKDDDKALNTKTCDDDNEEGKSEEALQDGYGACQNDFEVVPSLQDNGSGDILNEQPVKGNVKEEMEEWDVPIDRGWAWMIVFGAFWVHVVVVGSCKSFGVLFVVFQDKYEVSASALSTIMSLPIAMIFGLGIIANVLAAKLTCRLVMFIGGIIAFVGFFLTAFMSDFAGVLFTFGILLGFGFSLCYSPCVVMVGQHFRKYRSIAMGLSVAGSGVGSFIIPNLIRVLMHEFALSGCLIIFSGIVLNLTVFALLFRPWSNYRRKELVLGIGYIKADKVTSGNLNFESNNPNNDLYKLGRRDCTINDDDDDATCEIETLLATSQRGHVHCEDGQSMEIKTPPKKLGNGITCSDGSGRVGDGANKTNDERVTAKGDGDPCQLADEGREKEKLVVVCSGEKILRRGEDGKGRDGVEHKAKRLLDWTLLFHPVFLMYAFSNALATPGYGYIFVMLPDYAEENGHDRDTSALITSIIGISDLAGRLFFGWFSDLNLFPKRWGFIWCMGCSAVLNLILPSLSDFWPMVVYAVVFGFFSGSFITLAPVLYAEDLGTERLGSSFGLNGVFMAVAFLAGPVICGSIKDSTGSWDASFYVVGVLTLIAAVLPVFQPWGVRWAERKETRKGESVA